MIEAKTMTCPIDVCEDDPADGRYYVACVHIDGWTAQIFFSQDDEDRDDHWEVWAPHCDACLLCICEHDDIGADPHPDCQWSSGFETFPEDEPESAMAQFAEWIALLPQAARPPHTCTEAP